MGALCFLLKKALLPWNFKCQGDKKQKVSHLLVTSFKILITNTPFLVALATSQSQF